jgi:hypothetical protein
VRVRRPRHTDEEPVEPRRAPDDSDIGWGDDPRESRDEEWYRQQRPPHWE